MYTVVTESEPLEIWSGEDVRELRDPALVNPSIGAICNMRVAWVRGGRGAAWGPLSPRLSGTGTSTIVCGGVI